MVEIIESAGEQHSEKIATLDVGGTLVESNYLPSTFSYINQALGLSEEAEKRIFEKYQGPKGDITNYHLHADKLTYELNNTYNDRSRSDIGVYANAVLELHEDRNIISGADDFVKYLKSRGYHTMALSSAPKAVVRPFAEELGIDSIYRFRDYVFDDKGGFQEVYVDKNAPNGKEDIVKQIKETSEILHVGNGGNDVGAAEAANQSIRRRDWLTNQDVYEEAKRVV